MLRVICIMFGLAILGATAHVTIEHTGGYASPHAVLTIAISAGVGVGALILGAAWNAGRYALVVGIFIALLCGEMFGLVRTAERLVDAREAAQAPLLGAALERTKAKARVERAEVTLVDIGSTSPRIAAALAAKEVANQAVVESAAKRGCASNCRKLLEAQVIAASVEVEAARAFLTAQRDAATRELQNARQALAALPAAKSATPLADRLGIAPWLLDIVTAALGAIGANGIAACLLIFGAHAAPASRIESTAELKQDAPQPSRNRTKLKLIASTARPVLRPLDFIEEMLHPVDGSQCELAEVFEAYQSEADARNKTAVDGETFFDALSEFCRECDIESLQSGNLIYLQGVEVRASLSMAQA